MVGLLSQMEGSDHSMVSSTDSSTVAEQPATGLIDSSSVVEGVESGEGLSVKEEKQLAETCQETKPGKDGNDVKTGDSSSLDNANEGEGDVKELKSILKRRGQYTMRKVNVDFDLIPKRIPYDETKDYTIDILIVDKEPVKIKSWAALFAAQKLEAEAEEAAVAEADAALKKAEEAQRREAQKRANKAKLVKKGGDIKSVKEELELLKKTTTGESARDQKPDQDHQGKSVEDLSDKTEEGTTAQEISVGDPVMQNSARPPKSSNIGECEEFDGRERLNEDANSSNSEQCKSQPLGSELHHEPRIEDETTSGTRISSTEVDLLVKERLPEDIAVAATTLIEEILTETPTRLKAISFDEDNETDCTPVNTDLVDSEKEDDLNKEVTGPFVIELPNEGKTESTSEEREDMTDSVSEELQQNQKIISDRAEDVQRHNTICISTLLENDGINTQKCPTDEHKASDKVVSKKLNESLKKASPEIIQTAVRVLVDIEKVTLAVVNSLEPLVP